MSSRPTSSLVVWDDMTVPIRGKNKKKIAIQLLSQYQPNVIIMATRLHNQEQIDMPNTEYECLDRNTSFQTYLVEKMNGHTQGTAIVITGETEAAFMNEGYKDVFRKWKLILHVPPNTQFNIVKFNSWLHPTCGTSARHQLISKKEPEETLPKLVRKKGKKPAREKVDIECRVVGKYLGSLVLLKPVVDSSEYDFLHIDRRSVDVRNKEKKTIPIEFEYTTRLLVHEIVFSENLKSEKGKVFKKKWLVVSYSYTPPEPTERVVVAASVNRSKKGIYYASVLGTSFKRPSEPFMVGEDKISKGDLLLAKGIEYEEDGLLEETADGTTFFRTVSGGSSEKGFGVRSIRKLTAEEWSCVTSMCRERPSLTLQEAHKFIRDPMVAKSRLRHVIKENDVARFTTSVQFPHDYSAEGMTLRINICEKQRLTSKGVRSWQLESTLQISDCNECLVPYHDGHIGCENKESTVAILSMRPQLTCTIVEIEENDNQLLVKVVFTKESRKRLLLVEKTEERIQGTVCIGPRAMEEDAISRDLINGFDDLFDEDCRRFRELTGRVPLEEKVPRKMKRLQLGEIQLDDNQQRAVEIAASDTFLTAISAPAGSGKSVMLSGMCMKSREAGVKVLVGATTNMATTESVKKVHSNTPNSTVRLFSELAETMVEEGGTEEQLSLHRIVLKPEIIEKHPKLRASWEKLQSLDRNLASSKSVKEMVDSHEKVGKAKKKLVTEYCEAAAIQTFGTTIAKFVVSSAYCRDYERLILDETNQMDTITAFVLYCRYRHIRQMTFIGDSRQLPPYEVKGMDETFEDSEISQLYHTGELTRLEKLPNVAKFELSVIYRSNEKLVDLFWKTIYGEYVMASPLTKEVKMVAARKDLPRAKDGTPALFLHVAGDNKDDGSNEEELNTCIQLLDLLERVHEVDLHDVVIIVNHHAQKAALLQHLSGRGDIGLLKLPCLIETVDSFQGQEGCIVIFLTTKVAKAHSNLFQHKSLSFVANPNRGTVAVTRATDMIYLLGNWGQLFPTTFWAQFFAKATQAGAIAQLESDGSFCTVEFVDDSSSNE